MKRRSVHWLAVLLLAAVPLVVACSGGGAKSGGDSNATADAQKVTMNEFAFGPSNLTAKVNEPLKLNLINEGAVIHDFSVEGTDYASGEVAAGENKVMELVFKEAGTYNFLCTVAGHKESGMSGTITVTE